MPRVTTTSRASTIVEVTTAFPLSTNEKEQLSTILSEKLKRPILLKSYVDRDVIAGLVLRVVDHVIDATLRNRLDRLKERLLS